MAQHNRVSVRQAKLKAEIPATPAAKCLYDRSIFQSDRRRQVLYHVPYVEGIGHRRFSTCRQKLLLPDRN